MSVRVCFVCSGNICRSPTAEVVLRALAGAHADVEIDSAGTGGWHVGEEMDERSRATLVGAGYAPGRHVAKQFSAADFADRDLVVALDRGHVRALHRLAADARDPSAARAKIVLLRGYDTVAGAADPDVADPYYGGPNGFREVLEQVESACAGLLAALQQEDRPCL